MNISLKEQFGLGLLITVWLVYGGHQIGNMLVDADNGNIDALRIATDEPADAASDVAEAEIEVDMAALIAGADPVAGARVFKKCASCHAFEAGAGNKVGPNLWGIVGKDTASVPGFAYSEALTSLGGTWTAENLAAFLESPKAYVPGNKMTFRGLSKPEQRAAVIAFLQSSN